MVPFSAVERAILKQITPGKPPRIVLKTIREITQSVTGDVILGGSAAKKTNLKGDFDVDIFVRYPKKAGDIAGLLKESLASFHPEVVHGSRDYLHVIRGKFVFEVVPVLAIKNYREAENIMDMSPFHVDYVRSRIHKRPRLADHIRLTKQFCKAAKVYGAESYVGGFSGYVTELLILHHGGFHELLHAAAEWRERTIIDMERHLRNPEKQLNKSKLSPLIVVDPLDPTRNSAAALTRQKYELFRQKAQEYLAAKNKRVFFRIRRLKAKDFLLPGTTVFELKVTPYRGKVDIMGAKCLKAFEYMDRQLRLHEFTVKRAEWEFDGDSRFFFAVDKEPLSREERIVGPPLSMKEDVRKFRERHASTFEEGGRVHALEKREYQHAVKLLEHLFVDPYVLARVKKVQLKQQF